MSSELRPLGSSIPLVVEGGCRAQIDTGNVPLLLAEIRHALERLVDRGEPHAIDLRAMPLGPGEEDRLLAQLGKGELYATFDAMGRSELQECGYPGVWLVTHYNASGQPAARFVEITYVPALLASPPEEVRAGLERLAADLAA